MVSHGEVIAPDFSDFLLLDKAAACFRSSLFLAYKKSVRGCFNRIGYVFHADARADVEDQEEMHKFYFVLFLFFNFFKFDFFLEREREREGERERERG